MRSGIDLVLIDIMMPVMDGLEATQRIRSLSGPAGRIPIVAVSAYTSQEIVTSVVGVSYFMTFPLSLPAFAIIIMQTTGL